MSNLRLAAFRILGEPVLPWSLVRDAAASGADFSERQLLVRLFDSARTYFKNQSGRASFGGGDADA